MPILPDSRARIARGEKYDTEMQAWAVPVFCINCGRKAGHAVGDVRHITVLCDSCGVTHGAEGATWVSPDHAYRVEAQHEMIERYGRILTDSEANVAVADERSPLALLARDLAKPASRG